MNVSFSETNSTMPIAFSESGQSVNADFGDVQTVNIGLSAYQVAVKNGFKGTEQEWLNSLKGERGATGPQGPSGAQGPQGEKGEIGPAGANGKDGYTPIKGVDYFDGKDGAAGADGRTPEKGVDYFTDADKQEMVDSVITALPKYNGEVVSV